MLKIIIIVSGIILVLLTLVFVLSVVYNSTYDVYLYCKEQGYEGFKDINPQEFKCYKYVKLENQTGYEKEYSGLIKYGDFR